MKRLITIAMLLAATTLQAQVVIDKGNESRHIDDDILTGATYIGEQQGQTLWTVHVRGGYQIVGADHQMEPTRMHYLKIGAGEMLAATHSGDTVTLLLADRQGKNRTNVLVARCGVTGQWTVDTLSVLAFGKKDRCLLWGATSHSGNYIALCTIVEFTEDKQYSAFVTLLDAGGRIVYRHEYPLGTMDQIYVTDDGRIVTLGTEADEQTLHIIVNYVDQRHAVTDDATVTCETPREFHIANVIGNRLIAIGTVPGTGFRGAEELCGGTLAFAYDLGIGKIAGFTIRPFHNEDINIFYNKPTKKMQRDLMCEHATSVGCIAMPYGAVMVMGRNFEKISSADNGTEEHTFSRIGLHVVAVDTAANILWTRNVRRNDWQKGKPDLLNLGIAAMGDTLCLVKSESTRMPAAYEIGKEAKLLKMGDKSNLVLYTITAEGEVHKDVLEAKSKHSLLHLTPKLDIITLRGSRLRHIKLSHQ